MTYEPLLMLPGHMCDARLWSLVEPDLRSCRRDVVHADLTTDSSIEAIAASVLAKAPDRFVTVGLSMGGIVAMELYRQDPERFAGLVLSDTNASAELPERGLARVAQQAKVRDGGLSEVVQDELKPAYLAPQNRRRTDLLSLTYDMAMELGPEVFLRQSEALRTRRNYRPTLANIACPTLIMCGAEDPVCPPTWHEGMALTMEDARLELIEGAGHLPPLEQPQLFARTLLRWVDELHTELA